MGKKLGLCGAAIAAMWMALPALASAQSSPPPGSGPGMGPAEPQRDERGFWQRRGVYGGLGLGFGEMTADCAGCGDALESISVHFDIGWKLNPQFGLFLDGWALAHPEETEFGNATLTHAIATIGGQYWFAPQLWGKAGLGSAQLSISYDDGFDDETESVLGFMIGGGYELLSTPNFSLDAEVRLGNGFYEDGTVQNVALALAVHWHSLFSGAMIVVH